MAQFVCFVSFVKAISETFILIDGAVMAQTLIARYPAKALPQRLQNRAAGSFCSAPQEPQLRLTRRFAPQPEQKSEPPMLAAPQLPQRPGRGGT